MSKSDVFENQLLRAVFYGEAIPGLTTPAVNMPLFLALALHTADPGEGGDMGTFEATYTGYARCLVKRPEGFAVIDNEAYLAKAVDFPLATGGVETLTHFSVGDVSTTPTAATFTNGSADITESAHGFTQDTMVAFTTTGALPAGFDMNTAYYVLAAGLTANTFRVSATPGGVAIVAGSVGTGVHRTQAGVGGMRIFYSGVLNKTVDVKDGIQPRLTTGTKITED